MIESSLIEQNIYAGKSAFEACLVLVDMIISKNTPNSVFIISICPAFGLLNGRLMHTAIAGYFCVLFYLA